MAQASSPMALLRLLWLVSPALPIGSYAYSRGLEYAVSRGWVENEASARDWIDGVLDRQVATLDAPLVARLHDAYTADAPSEVARWSTLSCALRESAETALEDRQLGLALARVLREAGVARAQALPPEGSYVTAFALAAVHYGIARTDAVLAYLFAFAEAQVIAAIKLVPLGQTAGQRVLASLLARIPQLAERALALPDEEIGAYTPGLALASALHESQYTRLFRS